MKRELHGGMCGALMALAACGSAPPSASTTSPSSSAPTTVPSALRDDRDMVTQAMQRETSLAELGRLGEAQGRSDEVRQFGAAVVRDHAELQRQLQRLVQRHAGLVPATDAIDSSLARNRVTESALVELGGDTAAFDQLYMIRAVKGHEAGMEELAQMANCAAEPEFRNWAASAWGAWQRGEQWGRHLHEVLVQP